MAAGLTFVLVWTIDMERVGQRDGERDYRPACVAAGVGGENAWLAAVVRGLRLCVVGAFRQRRGRTAPTPRHAVSVAVPDGRQRKTVARHGRAGK